MSSSGSEMDLTPDFIKEQAQAVVENLLPTASKERYMKSYNDFMKWRAEKRVKSLSESVFLTYFNELSKKLQPSTLWSTYSMLRTVINTKHDVNIKNYTRLISFLKRQSDGFKCKKSKVFTAQEVETFLNQAPDEIYLATKSSDSEMDDTTRAANHTLRLYKKVAQCPHVNYDCVATKIQAAYRAYNVRRQRGVRQKDDDTAEKVRFQVKKEHTLADVVETKRCARKCSSASLAGSFMSLPLYKPYSIGQRSDITEVDEVGEAEKEHANFNYVANRREEIREPEGIKGKKTISFHHMPHVVELDDNDVMDEADEAEYESEEVEEDFIGGNFAVEGSSDHALNEQIPGNSDAITSPEILIPNEPEEDHSETSETWTDDIQDQVNKLSIVAKNSAEMLRTKRDVSRLHVNNGNDQVKTTEALTDEDYEDFLV